MTQRNSKANGRTTKVNKPAATTAPKATEAQDPIEMAPAGDSNPSSVEPEVMEGASNTPEDTTSDEPSNASSDPVPAPELEPEVEKEQEIPYKGRILTIYHRMEDYCDKLHGSKVPGDETVVSYQRNLLSTMYEGMMMTTDQEFPEFMGMMIECFKKHAGPDGALSERRVLRKTSLTNLRPRQKEVAMTALTIISNCAKNNVKMAGRAVSQELIVKQLGEEKASRLFEYLKMD